MLLVQEFLENHTFKELQDQHGVYPSFSKSGHKFSLNYDMIEAKESDFLAQECRGLILAAEDGHYFPFEGVSGEKAIRDNIVPGKTKILSYSMKRFFNYGQGAAADIDFSDPKLVILEKLDGTLCIVHWDPFISQWCVATRSVPEADLLMDNGIFTFRTLFEKALEDTTCLNFSQFTEGLNKSWTYCFELTTPYNRIVVNYIENKITLLAIRNIVTLKEIDPAESDLVREGIVPCVQAYTHMSIDELVSWVSSLDPMKNEGVVVRDKDFNRIKVKNASYVLYSKARESLGHSDRNCLSIVLSEKDDDFIPFLPEEIVKNLIKIKTATQLFIHKYDEAYQIAFATANAKMPGDKKTFALLVTKNKELWSAPMFQIFDHKSTSMRDFIIKNRNLDGTWSNSFLDKILELL